MRFFRLIRQKKLTSTLPIPFSSGASIHTSSLLEFQKATLALPTNLDEVANSVHECVPHQLPREEASQDDVRYFLYQVLTLKDYNLARKSPQWVLETCMLWQGDGKKLRSLPLDAFQQLCPLRPGYAVIDWAARGSRFRRQEMPPCGVRDEIGYRIKNIVESLRRKEQGHRGPGWQNASFPKASMVSPAAMSQELNSVPASSYTPQMPFLGSTSSAPSQSRFYSLGSPSMPILHHMSPTPIQQNSPCRYLQSPFSTQPYVPQYSRQIPGVDRSSSKARSASSRDPCEGGSSIAVSASTSSSFYHPGSPSSQYTDSTAQTSPIEPQNENQFWMRRICRPPSVANSVAGSQCSQSELSQTSAHPISGAKPSRYKSSQPVRLTRLHNRPFHPVHHLAHLRSFSYDSNSGCTCSETSLSPSDSATEKCGFRRHTIPPEMTQHSLRSRSPYSPSIASTVLLDSAPERYLTAQPRSDSPASSQTGTATDMLQDQSVSARPINNYKVDSHALNMAELIGCKSMLGPMRSGIAEGEKRRRFARGKSDGGYSTSLNDSSKVIREAEISMGPILRFQNPQTGQPRLTIYEAIEQQETLSKQHLEDQRRIEIQQGRLKTVYETIEEQELLNGKPQRGMGTYVGREWSTYL